MEAVLAREIKTFRKQFRSEHGRDPSKRDIERDPDIAASYSTWLAIKSGKASSSSSTASSSKRAGARMSKGDTSAASTSQRRRGDDKHGDDKHSDEVRKQKIGSSSSHSAGMAPPPTTPRRNKVTKDMSTVRTPIRNNGAALDVEMDSAIHDSAGSVRSLIDVPITPKQQPTKRRGHGRSLSADGDEDEDDDMTTPSPSALSSQRRRRQTAFDNGNSPSKLRSLIDSFGANMGKLARGGRGGSSNGAGRTPTKSDTSSVAVSRKSGIEEEDERLRRSLQASKKAVPQNGNLFTPRTKARKRLRGELVVTPSSKASERGDAVPRAEALRQTATTPTKAAVVRPAKRQRGMGTLKDFGIVAIAGPQSKTMPRTHRVGTKASFDDDDDDDDEIDDDLIGPSPSARRVVVMPTPVFRPLFEEAVKAGALASRSAPSSSQQSVAATGTMLLNDDGEADTDTALTTPAVQEDAIDSDEEDRRMVRAYQRFEPTSRRHAHAGLGDDDDDDDDEGVLGGLAAFATAHEEEVDVQERKWAEADEDDDESSMLRSLSIASPQCKRARRQQRRMAAQSVYNLLHGDGAAMALEDAEDEEVGDSTAGGGGGASAKTKAAGSVTVHGHGKTARMMRGTLTKTARRNLAAAELADEQRALAAAAEQDSAASALPSIRPHGRKATMILRRGRDDDGGDEHVEHDGEAFDLRSQHTSAAEEEDDDWASDVDSVDYGLGDGYMDDVDVL